MDSQSSLPGLVHQDNLHERERSVGVTTYMIGLLETHCNDAIKRYNDEWIIKLTTSGYTLLQRFEVVSVSLATAINE